MDEDDEVRRRQTASDVQAAREARGLSVSQAAKLAGIDRATWTAAEEGTRNTRGQHLAAMEKALNVPIGTFGRPGERAKRAGHKKPDQALVELGPASAVSKSAEGLDGLSLLERELVLATHAEIARRATNLVQDRGQAEGEAWLEYVLDLRERHRPAVERDAPEGDDAPGAENTHRSA